MTAGLFAGAEPVARLVSKTQLAEMLGCVKSNVTKLTRDGGPLHAAVQQNGQVDVTLALRLYAERTNPAKRRSLAILAAAGPQVDLAQAHGAPSGSYAQAKERAARAAAETAEINLQKLRGELVEATGVRQAGEDLGALLPQLLGQAMADAAARGHAAATAADAGRMAAKLTQELLGRLAAAVEQRVREATADA